MSRRSLGSRNRGPTNAQGKILIPKKEVACGQVSGFILNEDQKAAKLEILGAFSPSHKHILTGNAGTGKTTLLQEVVRDLLAGGAVVSVTAPTHKAVSVLSAKMRAADLDVPCLTTHSLLSLEPKPDDAGRLVLQRRKRTKPVTSDVVIIDEASMCDSGLISHIETHLPHVFLLYVGDPAQLPPVNERESLAFGTPSRSHLDTVVRQEADNPVLAVATAIRRTQEQEGMDWSWCTAHKKPPRGVYLPGLAIDRWMQKAFKSTDFQKDNDTFRYLCWTNDRVAEINARVRWWIYGDAAAELPFVPGEMALVRQPIMRDKAIVFSTNEEVPVEEVASGSYIHKFPGGYKVPQWSVEIPTWEVVLLKGGGEKVHVHLPRDDDLVAKVNERLVREASIDRKRWIDFYAFKTALARLQSVYAMTVHNSQGSTFKSVFLDVLDIRKRERSNPLEFKQLLYTAATRPTTSLMLVGV